MCNFHFNFNKISRRRRPSQPQGHTNSVVMNPNNKRRGGYLLHRFAVHKKKWP